MTLKKNINGNEMFKNVHVSVFNTEEMSGWFKSKIIPFICL